MAKIWIITGVSSGLGKALALHAAQKGDTVVGTVRHSDQGDEFELLVPGFTFAVKADVRDRASLENLVSVCLERFGKIDVLVNNAGYGLVGAVEELSEEELRNQMEVNFFGALILTQLVLPTMRKNRKGHIFNISSIAGINGTAGLALYNASKFALEGFSEGMMLECRPLGILVTIVEPGPFRTHWAGKGLVHAKHQIADYEPTVNRLRSRLGDVDGNQPGDPARAAELMYEVALSEGAPMRLLLGKPGYTVVEGKIQRLSQELAAWKEKGIATDFPE
jgi:NAD(P)-dependent dehydrogenase (short-subunit alcohol dehydrogenase family)